MPSLPSLAGDPAPAPPTGTITFLFTDVERSARFWERSPDAMRAALTRHDALAESHVGTHGGLLIKDRGEGDSLFAVFGSAPDAVRAASLLQQALAAEPWPEEAPLRVRMALHTGEADLRDRDYYGVAVNRCARLRSLAGGGQILLSSLTRSLVHHALPDGAFLMPLGMRTLRDLAEPEYVYQLIHPDHPAPLPAEPPTHGPSLTSLARYETDLADVRAFLANAQQSVRSPFGRTSVFQALRQANQAGLAGVRRAMDTERSVAPADHDAVLTTFLAAHEKATRLDLLRALTGRDGVTPWEAKHLVDDFCRHHAPHLAGYDGGLLKSLAARLRRPPPKGG